jgi:hypothetical protein
LIRIEGACCAAAGFWKQGTWASVRAGKGDPGSGSGPELAWHAWEKQASSTVCYAACLSHQGPDPRDKQRPARFSRASLLPSHVHAVAFLILDIQLKYYISYFLLLLLIHQELEYEILISLVWGDM